MCNVQDKGIYIPELQGWKLNFKSGMLTGYSFTDEKNVYTFATVLKLFC